MMVQSAGFFVLFLSALFLYYIVPLRAKQPVLLLASAIFYASAGAGYLLLLGAAVCLSYGAARCIAAAKTPRGRKAVLAFFLVLFFTNLCFFKYYDLFGKALVRGLYDMGMPAFLPDYGLLAPLGISFYTFTVTGYLIDVYRGKLPPEKNLLQYAVFVSFFPMIAAGPIARAQPILNQLVVPRKFDYANFSAGAARILWGFFKKFVVANTIATLVNNVFADISAQAGPFVLLACLAYSYQLYCDFSGYSDIAVGVARTFGIAAPENFARPFAARTYADLWRRWHISLTAWFRDYLYISLGGNRKGRARAVCNQLAVFALSGIWHGAGFGFLVWGVLNGVYVVVGKLTAKQRDALALRSKLYRGWRQSAVIQIGFIYLLFTSCIVFFRADNFAQALAVYAQLGVGWGAVLTQPIAAIGTLKTLLSGTSMVLLTVCIPLLEFVEWRAACATLAVGEYLQTKRLRMALYYLLLILLALFGVLGASGFIYFQF